MPERNDSRVPAGVTVLRGGRVSAVEGRKGVRSATVSTAAGSVTLVKLTLIALGLTAAVVIERDLDSLLTFFQFDPTYWTVLRTTNPIERLNKEFKRRTKPMEIVAGENACYRLLAFISLKMELSWRANPIGKVRPNLPLYQIYTK